MPYIIIQCWKVAKFILYPDMDPDPDQSQNLTDRSLAEGLSLHKIWFISVVKFFR